MKDLVEALEFARKRMGVLVEKPANTFGEVLVQSREMESLMELIQRIERSLSVREACKDIKKSFEVREIETVINSMQPAEGFARMKIESDNESTKWLNVSRADLSIITKLLETKGE